MKALLIDKDLLKKAAVGHGENALELRIMITKQQWLQTQLPATAGLFFQHFPLNSSQGVR